MNIPYKRVGWATSCKRVHICLFMVNICLLWHSSRVHGCYYDHIPRVNTNAIKREKCSEFSSLRCCKPIILYNFAAKKNHRDINKHL